MSQGLPAVQLCEHIRQSAGHRDTGKTLGPFGNSPIPYGSRAGCRASAVLPTPCRCRAAAPGAAGFDRSNGGARTAARTCQLHPSPEGPGLEVVPNWLLGWLLRPDTPTMGWQGRVTHAPHSTRSRRGGRWCGKHSGRRGQRPRTPGRQSSASRLRTTVQTRAPAQVRATERSNSSRALKGRDSLLDHVERGAPGSRTTRWTASPSPQPLTPWIGRSGCTACPPAAPPPSSWRRPSF